MIKNQILLLFQKYIFCHNFFQIGDNFDQKYCEAPDKIGNDTRARYANYLKDDSLKEDFKVFYYYFNEFDINDKNNSKDKKFNNPHLNLQSMEINYNEYSAAPMIGNQCSDIDSKYRKLMQSSGSTSSLLKQYRQSSGNDNNSTSGSKNN